MILVFSGVALLTVIALAEILKRRQRLTSLHNDKPIGPDFNDRHVKELVEIMSRRSGALQVQHRAELQPIG